MLKQNYSTGKVVDTPFSVSQLKMMFCDVTEGLDRGRHRLIPEVHNIRNYQSHKFMFQHAYLSYSGMLRSA